MGIVYLLHFDKKYYHVQHYIGYTDNLEKRMKRHNDKHGSKLVAAMIEKGIGFTVVRTWYGVDRKFERSLKNQKKSNRFCPICIKERNDANIRRNKDKMEK